MQRLQCFYSCMLKTSYADSQDPNHKIFHVTSEKCCDAALENVITAPWLWPRWDLSDMGVWANVTLDWHLFLRVRQWKWSSLTSVRMSAWWEATCIKSEESLQLKHLQHNTCPVFFTFLIISSENLTQTSGGMKINGFSRPLLAAWGNFKSRKTLFCVLWDVRRWWCVGLIPVEISSCINKASKRRATSSSCVPAPGSLWWGPRMSGNQETHTQHDHITCPPAPVQSHIINPKTKRSSPVPASETLKRIWKWQIWEPSAWFSTGSILEQELVQAWQTIYLIPTSEGFRKSLHAATSISTLSWWRRWIVCPSPSSRKGMLQDTLSWWIFLPLLQTSC